MIALLAVCCSFVFLKKKFFDAGEPARSVLNKLLKVMSVVAVDAGWEEVASLPRSETPEPPVGASGLSSSATPAAAAAAASATVANAETTVAGSCVQCPDRQCGRFLPHAFKRNQCRICYHGADQHTAEPFGPQITETPDAGTISPRTEGVLRASSNKVGISRMRSSVMISEKEGEGARSPREKPVSQAMNRRKSWADVGGSKALMRENGTIDVAELALRAEDSTFVMEPNLLKEIILQLKALDQSREESKAAKSALGWQYLMFVFFLSLLNWVCRSITGPDFQGSCFDCHGIFQNEGTARKDEGKRGGSSHKVDRTLHGNDCYDPAVA